MNGDLGAERGVGRRPSRPRCCCSLRQPDRPPAQVRATIKLGQAALPRTAVAFSPDGKMLAVRTPTDMRVFDSATGKLLWSRPSPMLGGPELAPPLFTPDGKLPTLIVPRQFGPGANLELCDSRTGNVRHTLKGLPTAGPSAEPRLAISPDGRTVATAGTIRVIRRGPGGPMAGTGSGQPAVIRLWDLPGGKERATLKSPGQRSSLPGNGGLGRTSSSRPTKRPCSLPTVPGSPCGISRKADWCGPSSPADALPSRSAPRG